ncbi:hypothetical protein LCGC14_0426640 [marine sediment metagenome]|uniref:Uncharacterized protein n=1 Tax=marine sediment metagenome TaxID=412755 RepID=A0A0F9SVL3_9ZZZZ
MLRIRSASFTGMIEVRFDHKICGPNEIKDVTGVSVDGERRCSLVTVSLEGNVVGRGMAICHPGDNFCRAAGRKKALSYAVFPLKKEDRREVWRVYLGTCNS